MRRRKPMKRSGLRRRPKPRPLRLPPEITRDVEQHDRLRWLDGMERRCAMADEPDHECEGRIEGHHVITKQTLRRRGLAAHIWDPRDRMPLCGLAHHRHTVAYERVPRDLVPGVAIEFAHELGLLHLIERVYPERSTDG